MLVWCVSSFGCGTSLCFYEESASVQLSDHAAKTGSSRYSVPPGLKNIWYRDVFIFLVPTWYRSTGSSDNTTGNLCSAGSFQVRKLELNPGHGTICCELFPRRSRDQETLGYLSSRSYSLLRTRCASLQSSKSNYCSAQ